MQSQLPAAGLILRGEPISLKSPQGAGVKAFPLLPGQLWGFPLLKETWGFSLPQEAVMSCSHSSLVSLLPEHFRLQKLLSSVKSAVCNVTLFVRKHFVTGGNLLSTFLNCWL